MSVLNTHPMALEHLMAVLMQFYVGKSLFHLSVTTRAQLLFSDVENTGASSQFYDKFGESFGCALVSSLMNISYMFHHRCTVSTAVLVVLKKVLIVP